MHLVGGFSDDRHLSQKLTHQLLSKFAVFSNLDKIFLFVFAWVKNPTKSKRDTLGADGQLGPFH